MAIDAEEAFGIEPFGLVLKDENSDTVGYFTVAVGDPTGTPAPINTWVFAQDTQVIWYKFGAGDNDWKAIRFINVSTGPSDAGKGVETDSGGKIDGSLVDEANDEFTVKNTGGGADLIIDTSNPPFNGTTFRKSNASGFVNWFPNAETTQFLFSDPNSANGVNRLFFDVDNQGDLYLQVLGGAGAGADIIATDGGKLKPSSDGTSDLGELATQWNQIFGKAIMVSSNDTTPERLEDKLVAGNNVAFEVLNEGANEQISVKSKGSFRYKLDADLVIEDAFSLNVAEFIWADSFDIILNGDAILEVD